MTKQQCLDHVEDNDTTTLALIELEQKLEGKVMKDRRKRSIISPSTVEAFLRKETMQPRRMRDCKKQQVDIRLVMAMPAVNEEETAKLASNRAMSMVSQWTSWRWQHRNAKMRRTGWDYEWVCSQCDSTVAGKKRDRNGKTKSAKKRLSKRHMQRYACQGCAHFTWHREEGVAVIRLTHRCWHDPYRRPLIAEEMLARIRETVERDPNARPIIFHRAVRAEDDAALDQAWKNGTARTFQYSCPTRDAVNWHFREEQRRRTNEIIGPALRDETDSRMKAARKADSKNGAGGVEGYVEAMAMLVAAEKDGHVKILGLPESDHYHALAFTIEPFADIRGRTKEIAVDGTRA